jgi:UDP-glucose 4-epimerase
MPNNLIPFVTQTAAGIREELTVFGNDYNTPDGTCVRDYIHVVDLAKAHVKALDKLFAVKEDLFHDVINVGTGKGESVLDVIHTFEKIAGIKLNYKIGPRRAGDIQEIFADVQKSANVLSWKAEKNMEEAIVDAWNWQQNLKNLNLV